MTPESIRIALSIKGLLHYHNRHVILFCFRYYAILWLSKSVHNEIDSQVLQTQVWVESDINSDIDVEVFGRYRPQFTGS